MSHLPLPPLVDLRVEPAELAAWSTGLAHGPSLHLDPIACADLECVGRGIYAPLEGFMTQAEAAAVVAELRLPSGAFFPWPIVLRCSEAEALACPVGGRVRLLDEAGHLVGSLQVEECFQVDAAAELKALFGTEDRSHPGVAAHLARGDWALAGPIRYAPPKALPFAQARWGAREAREAIHQAGWQRVVGFQTRNPIHRAHEALLKAALERVDGLLLHPLVGETKGDDVPAGVRWASYEVLLKHYFPEARVHLAAYPAAMRYAGPREALLHALSRRNLGCTHFIVGRDHAGVGSHYGPYEALELVQHHAPELGLEVVGFDAAFWCQACGAIASRRTCPHHAEQHVAPSGTEVRRLLQAGLRPPATFTRPEVAEVLLKAMALADVPPEVPKGVTLWLTGLSGAGKSTIAQALRPALAALGRQVELLDGDEVRLGLNRDLGFSQADRIENNRRLGYLAGVLNRNGVDVIVAAIAPYEAGRAAAKGHAPEMRVVHVDAPVEECARRDVKGLYAKAMAGELQGFTGVTDPYEAPAHPEVHLRTDRLSVAECVEVILHRLGLGPAPAPR